MIINSQNSDWSGISAHECLSSFGTLGNVRYSETAGKRLTREPPALLPYRLPIRSRTPDAPRFPSPVPAFRVDPSGLGVVRLRGSSGRSPFHHRESAAAVCGDRTV